MKHLKSSQIALSNFPYYKYSLDYTLNSLKKLGAESIELYACDPHFHIDDCGPAQVKILKKKLKDRGMKVICVTPEQVKYPINIASVNPECRRRSMETYTKVIQYASELDCQTVQFFAGWGPLDQPYEEAWSRSVDSLGFLADLAEGYGITITIEAADRTLTVLTGTDKIRKMIEAIHSKNLRGMIDTVCLLACDETIEQAINNIGENNIKHFHFSDVMMDKSTLDHIIPGQGTMNLDYVLEKMDGIRYDGYFSIELMSPYEKQPEEAMKKAAVWMRERLL